MTVTYTAEVANCRGLGCFWKLLFRWKGSIYKLLWPNLVVYISLYYGLNFLYRFALDEDQKRIFEQISKYCLSYSDLIPLSFVLGFYVNLVVKRWWEMYISLPSTDTLALFVSNSIHGQDERCRLMRRTIMRYVNLSYCLILSMVSTRVKKRFPTLDHLVDAGVMLPNEKKIFDDLNAKSRVSKYWMPLVWAGSIIARARKEGRIRDDFAVKTLLDELCNFRSKCGALNGYDWISIPLVYTQVVTLAVYSFFMATLMGRQLVGDQSNLYFPIFAFLQFFFYMGWLKVAESLCNPFGEDDDDFETNWLIDRNLQVSYLIVDEMHAEHPELIKDQYWDDILPEELPHTVASQPFRSSPYMGSTAHLAFSPQQAEIFTGSQLLNKLDEVSEEDYTTDDEKAIDGGESGGLARTSRPRKIKRQVSSSDQSEPASSFPGSSHMRVSRKPSVLSVIQRAFTREGNMGSTVSLRSASRKVPLGRTTSKPSRPQSPALIQKEEEIFKMSDLSLNAGESSAAPADRVTGKPPKPRPKLAALNMRSSSEQKDKKHKNFLNVEQDAIAVSSEEDEPLLPSNAPSPMDKVSRPAYPSAAGQLHGKSPKIVRKSPQPSPKLRAPPVSFTIGSDLSQNAPLADLESIMDAGEDVDGEKNRTGPIIVPSRSHKESYREPGEPLEPIEEHTERSEVSSPQKTPLIDIQDDNNGE